MIDELECVVLTRDLPEHGLKVGDAGTVVLVYNNGEAYEVEFVGLDGDTLALTTLLADAVRPAREREIAHARAIA